MLTTVFIATSVDGFIARTNGSIEWLPVGGEADSSEDYGYHTFMDSVDAVVMGRHTYQVVVSFDSWPYGDKPVFVLSSQVVDIPVNLRPHVQSMSASPHEVVERLGDRGFRHLYVDGGKTIQGFLYEGLVQRIIITRVPILLGTGIPLFGPLPQDVRLRIVTTRQFSNDLEQITYEVLRRDT